VEGELLYWGLGADLTKGALLGNLEGGGSFYCRLGETDGGGQDRTSENDTRRGAQAKVIVDGKIRNTFVRGIGVRQRRWFVCTTVQPHSSQSPEKPGTKQHDFEQTNTNVWIC
jgi:hypothetical protein